jgi:hypothetical protein
MRKPALRHSVIKPSPPDLIGWPGIPEPWQSIINALEYRAPDQVEAMTVMGFGSDFVVPGLCPGQPRLDGSAARKTWMAGKEPGHDELKGSASFPRNDVPLSKY